MNQLHEILNDANLSDETKIQYRRAVNMFCSLAGNDPQGWTPPAVKAWRNQILAEGRKVKHVNVLLAALKGVSKRWARFNMNLMMDFAGPIDPIRSEAEYDKVREAMTPEQVKLILNTCKGDDPIERRDYAIITLGVRTGMRRSSLAKLRIDDMDFSSGRIDIWIKGNRRHSMPPVGKITMDALAPWRHWLTRHSIVSGRFFRSFRGLLNGPEMRESITGSGIYWMICRRAKMAGLDGVKISPHVLRNTFITSLRMLGFDEGVIQAFTGHVRGSRMIDLYTDHRKLAIQADPMSVLPDLGGRP